MFKSHIRLNRQELSGAFGDIGTDLPLIAGMILASGMNPAAVLVVFGLAQLASALSAVLLPYGFLVGMVAGTLVAYALKLWLSIARTVNSSNTMEVEDA